MSDKVRDQYLQHLEWESLEFPILLTKIYSDKHLYEIPENAIIEVWRGVDFKLKATLSCITSNQFAFEIDKDKLEGSFIPNETISGTSLDGFYLIELEGCVVKDETSRIISLEPLLLDFNVTLSIKNISRKFFRTEKVDILFEWYLCSKMNAWFPRSTSRSLKSVFKKVRHDIDSEEQDRQTQKYGATRDYTLIDIPGLKCIVAIVPSFYEPSWAEKICIEFRTSFGEIPGGHKRKIIGEFVGFILGTQLLKIGSTEIDANQSVISQFSMNYWGDNAMAKCSKIASPPIRINMPTQNWIRLEEILNKLLPKYLELENELHLSASLWKYWVGYDLAVGTNLPIFSSAIDGLAAKYLQKHSEISLAYMDINEYNRAISEGLGKILENLKGKEFGHVISNKIKGAVFRGANEKIMLFFNSLELKVGALEKKAIRARNIMAHATIEGADDIKLKEYAKLTQVYKSLFNRVLLRILAYDGEYIDYYASQNSRHISEAIGGT